MSSTHKIIDPFLVCLNLIEYFTVVIATVFVVVVVVVVVVVLFLVSFFFKVVMNLVDKHYPAYI